MKSHWWSYFRNSHEIVFDVRIYKTRFGMRKGAERHAKREFISQKCDPNVVYSSSALCRTWSGTNFKDEMKVHIAVIFLSEQDMSYGIIAHEAFHASGFFIQKTHGKQKLLLKGKAEEDVAEVTEIIVNKICGWMDAGYPDEYP